MTVAVAFSISLAAAGPAAAVVHHPTRGFARFADCPLSNPAVTLCALVHITHGYVTIGHKSVPIEKPILFQGGLIEKVSGPLTFVAAEDGETLPKTTLNVPGGLPGLGGSGRPTTANATLELAALASSIELNVNNLFDEAGTALRLLVKVKLSSLLLGSCYIGNNTTPLVLQLTTGTTSPSPPNKPIRGEVGALESSEEANIIGIRDPWFVDNAFPVPAASNCTGPYASLVDAAVGLPSPAGHDTAILAGKFEVAAAEAVKASE